MSVPAYASHLDQKTYDHWSSMWKHFHERSDIKTPEDAAALLMIAAVEADSKTSKHLIYHGEHNTSTMASLVQYKSELTAQGMEIAIIDLFDPTEHGLSTLRNLTDVVNYYSDVVKVEEDEHLSEKTILKFMELLRDIPPDDVCQSVPGSLSDQPAEEQIARHVLGTAGRYVVKHGYDAKAVQNSLVSYASYWFENVTTSNKLWSHRRPIDIIETFAPDECVDKLRPSILKLFHNASASKEQTFINKYKELRPRLFGNTNVETLDMGS